jgi:hypothetical protein
MGISNKTDKTSGTTTQDLTQKVTPNNPVWVDQGLGQFGGVLAGLTGADPASFVAGANPLLNLAGANASGFSGTPWAYDGAADVTRGIAQADTPDIASGIGKFMSPYLKNVVGATSADLSASEGRTRAQQALNLTRSGAFGGSGAALTQSATEGELARARATTIGGLLNEGYGQALGGATSQAQAELASRGQRLGAAGQLAGIANDYGANTRANATTQAGIGGQLQAIDQARTGAPLSTAALLASIWGGLPLGLEHGTDSTGTVNGTSTGTSSTSGATLGDWLNYFASNAKAAASAGGH